MWVFLLDTCSIQEGGEKKTDDTNNSKGIEDSIKAKLLKCDIFPERFPVPQTPVIHILQRLSSRRPSRLYENHVIQQERQSSLLVTKRFFFFLTLSTNSKCGWMR